LTYQAGGLFSAWQGDGVGEGTMAAATQFEVLTGDLIGSRRLGARTALLPGIFGQALDPAPYAGLKWPARVAGHQIHRGDEFQLVIEPAAAGGLAAALFLLCSLKRAGGEMPPLEARIAVGVGGADYFDAAPPGGGFQGDGEAFQASGLLLEAMKKDGRRVAVTTPWPDVNAELLVSCRLLDQIVAQWTPQQASSMQALLRGETQDSAAEAAGISQSAVAQRLRRAGAPAVRALLERYAHLLATARSGGEERS
jgi:hypothetical protein